MSAVEVSLAAAALAIGATGAWSPCGFSMVETIGLAGDRGRRATTIAACAAFVPGAVAGGAATFGLLSVLGNLVHGAAGRPAYLVAAAVAVAAAAAEARGVRIAPQIRRQLPEGWRWTMPLPVASCLYGVLLGLGFTTFVLSFGVWALGGIGLALGDPGTGLVIGAAFGGGRAIPVVVLAPAVDSALAKRCIGAMAERPALYRFLRLGDAVALGLVAVALATTSASAERVEVANGADPSAVGTALAFQKANRQGVLRTGGVIHGLPGTDPGLGGPYGAVISGSNIRIFNRFTLNVVASVGAFHPQAVAVSQRWLAYLSAYHGRYALRVRSIRYPGNPGSARVIAAVSAPAVIGRPSIGRGRVAFAVSKRHENGIRLVSLASGKRRTPVSSRSDQLLNPSLLGKRLLYVRVSRGAQGPLATAQRPLHQSLILRRVAGHPTGHRIHRLRGFGRKLWTTSLTPKRAYVTLLGSKKGPRIVSVQR
jgi:hypothetical protein